MAILNAVTRPIFRLIQDIKKDILKAICILIACHFIVWFLTYWSIIPYYAFADVRLGSFLWAIALIAVLITLGKKVVRANKFVTVAALTIVLSIVSVVAISAFRIGEAILNAELVGRGVTDVFLRIIPEAIVEIIISFFVAFQLITRQTALLILMIIGFLVLAVVILINFFPLLLT